MQTKSPDYDVIVIGGGPAGSAAATLIAKDGHRVLLLERAKHPRYQIGESLLPHTLGICHILGLGDELDRAGFMPKNGGVWYWGSQSQPGWGFDFGELPKQPLYGRAYAYQVERMRFDELLFRHAGRCGVELREEVSVQGVIEDSGRVAGVRYVDSMGRSLSVRSRFVVDASGHTSSLYARVGKRVYAEKFRNVALFGYFNGGKRLPSPQSGSILNVTFDKGWFWYIPLTETLTSVGAVIAAENAGCLKVGSEEAMSAFIDECPLIKDFLSGAERVRDGVYGQLRVRKDWSYCNTRFWGPGLVLVGDAACFVDPLFSSGVHLATYSALLAARSINTILRNELDETDSLSEFEARYRLEYMTFFDFLSTFYDTSLGRESYFRRAHEIVGSGATYKQAFVQLVSGLSQQAQIVDETRGHAGAVATPDGPPSHSNVVLYAGDDIAEMADSSRGRSGSLRLGTSLSPSSDGLRWTKQ